MKRLIAGLLLMAALAAPAIAEDRRPLSGFGEQLATEIDQVLTAVDEAIAERGAPAETAAGWSLTTFRLWLKALFGWKVPGFVTLTVYPQIELWFERPPVR